MKKNTELQTEFINLGIDVTSNDLSEEDLSKNGYRRLNDIETAQISQLFGYIPQITANQLTKSLTEQAFNEAIKDSFKCILDPSMHLATRRGTTDVFIGSGLDNISNQVAGQASWIKNNAPLSVSTAPQVALGVFNAMSAITGQYFMAQINSNLDSLKASVNEIISYLESAQRSELKAVQQELSEIFEDLQYICNNNEERTIQLGRVKALAGMARKNINFYRSEISTKLSQIKIDQKEDDFTKTIKNVSDYLILHKNATHILNLCRLLDVYLSNKDTELIEHIKNRIQQSVDEHKELYISTISFMEDSLNTNKYLNKKSIPQYMAKYAILGLGLLNPRKIHDAFNTSEHIDRMFDEKRESKKNEQFEMIATYDKILSNVSTLQNAVSAIDYYIESLERKKELVHISGNCYIKNIQ